MPPAGPAEERSRISRDDVAHVARLALLDLSDEELGMFTEQLAAVLDHAADVAALSQQVLDQCRDLIRDDPEPWLWTYKRWKRRPTPDRDGYPFYSRYARTGDSEKPE